MSQQQRVAPGLVAVLVLVGLVACGSSCAAGERGASSSCDDDCTSPPTIGGTVVDPFGGPVSGALVELVLDSSAEISRAQEADVRGTVVTGVDGRFAFGVEACPVPALFRRDRFVLRVRHADFAVERATHIAFGDPGSADRRIALSPGSCSVAGVCRDADGAPLAGVEVRAYDLAVATTDPDGALERAATSAADGSFAIGRLKPGLKRIRAVRAGYASTLLLCTGLTVEGAAVLVDFALRPGRTISGAVVAQDTGRGLPGAVVTATPTTLGPPAHVGAVGGSGAEGRAATAGVTRPNDVRFAALTFRVDAAGRFAAEGLEAGIYELTVNAPGYLTSTIQSAATGGESASFSLLPSARILGRVTDEETGRPVEAFTVRLCPIVVGATAVYDLFEPEDRRPFGPPSFRGGSFEYVDATPGPFVVIAEATGYAGGRSEPIVILQSARREGVEIKLSRGATVVGRVVDDEGGPVADAAVLIAAAAPGEPYPPGTIRCFATRPRRAAIETRTLPDGTYRLPRILDGRYVVRVRHQDFVPFDDPNAIEVPRRGEVVRPDYRLVRGGRVRGRVVTKEGAPDPQAMVTIWPTVASSAFDQRQASTGTDGRFEVSGLMPGECRVVVGMRGGQVDLGPLLQAAAFNAGRTGGVAPPATSPYRAVVVVVVAGETVDVGDV
jgi:protocatechuate 3,4-dioxygenase beta subunit